MQSTSTFDRFISRLLRVKPASEHTIAQERSAENTFMFSMLMTGVRCILQYAVLPFVLPLLNLSEGIAEPLILVINLVALGALVHSVRKFWIIDYKHKRAYLGVALVGGAILLYFLVGNLSALFS